MNVNETTSLEELFKIAKVTATELKKDEKFIVKELFRGFEWERISKGTRSKLGAMFFSYSKNEGTGIITSLGKTPQNQQKYIKL